MSSEIKVNSLQDKTGTRVLASDSGSAWSWGSGLPSGSIVQVQSTQYTTSTTMTSISNNTDYVLCSGTAGSGTEILNVNITPRIYGSKIWLQCCWTGELSADNAYNSMFFFYRDTTKLANTDSSTGTMQIGIAPPTITYHADDNGTTLEHCFYQYFDLHGQSQSDVNSATQITYKCGFRTKSSPTLYINKNVDDTTNNDIRERGVSSICAIELAP